MWPFKIEIKVLIYFRTLISQLRPRLFNISYAYSPTSIANIYFLFCKRFTPILLNPFSRPLSLFLFLLSLICFCYLLSFLDSHYILHTVAHVLLVILSILHILGPVNFSDSIFLLFQKSFSNRWLHLYYIITFFEVSFKCIKEIYKSYQCCVGERIISVIL